MIESPVQISGQSNFQLYLFGLIAELTDKSKGDVVLTLQERSNYAKQILKLAATRLNKTLLDDIKKMNENDQLRVIDYFATAFTHSYVGELRNQLLNEIESLLLVNVYDSVKSSILQLIIKENVQ